MLTADALLRIWERLQHASRAERGLRFLTLALPGHHREALAGFDLGLRDWHLLRLRQAWFGPEVSGCAECPACGEDLEIAFDAGAIGDPCEAKAEPYTSQDGRRFRLPNVGDLLAIAGAGDVETASRRLLERCSLDGLPEGGDAAALADQVDAGLAALASERGIHLNLSCARCGQPSTHALDPGEFLWHDVAAFASALLDDVHRLAQAYGWPERDILAMSAARRAAYLDRVQP
jgi:hypothetical protein